MPNLLNKSILIAGSRAVVEKAINKFQLLGINVIPFKTIKIKPFNKEKLNERVLSQNYSYIIFTSINCVNSFFGQLDKENYHYIDSSILVVTGISTNIELKKYNYSAGIIPKEFSAYGILQELKKIDLSNKKILVLKSDKARDELVEGLKTFNAVYDEIEIYKNTLPNETDSALMSKNLKGKDIEIYVFTSPSAFENFIEIEKINDVEKYFENKKIAIIGTTTNAAIEKRNLKAFFKPKEFTIDGIYKEIESYYATYN